MEIVWQAEDSLREKKGESDLRDLLKTLVAFANSVAPGDTAKIFIGEMDDGTVQGVKNPESINRTIVKEADKIYPPIYYRTEVYERDGKQCVRVDIKHNGQAPHFGGPAWVRQGSQSPKATEELYQQMVDQRQSKVRILLQWLNKLVTVAGTERPYAVGPGGNIPAYNQEWSVGEHQATLTFVNGHWATFRVDTSPTSHAEMSEPLEKVLLSWDNQRQRPKVVIKNTTTEPFARRQ
jgi:schlafen family protein